jgi:uncharacterized Zn finger protein
MLNYFAVFCKNCGSYEIKIIRTQTEFQDIIFECQNCQVAESIKE